MSSWSYRYMGLCLLSSLALGACMDGTGGVSSRDGSGSGSAVERDVEDPRIFSRRENGLWDGRPSFGGVWVAHPDARAPERVIIRNTENGRETVGSLFTRERLNPGPPFQVSGEAATAIGMLAGAPALLDVVALRVEEPAAEPEIAAATEAAPPPAEQVAAAPAPATNATSDAQPAASTAETLIAMPQAEPAPRRQGLFGRVFGRREAPADADPGIETSVLDPVDMAQAPVQTSSPPPTPMPSPAAAPAPAPASAQTAASSLDRPYIQLGIFSVEANARNAERMARGADLPARVVAGQSQGNQFWRVVVGPAADAAAQRQMLARIKALGFNDAYAVRR